MARWKISPVLIWECRSIARRWQTFAARTVFLGILFLCLVVVWATRVSEDPHLSLNDLARIGEVFFFAIAGTQLALVLLAAPAYTAGAICLDRARGTLADMLVTDLSAAEIVLSKLAARALPVLGLVLAALPILALAMLLGGIDPLAMAGSCMVALGVALVGCALALALSVWSNKPHEVLLTTYLMWVVLLLALPGWVLLPAHWGLGSAPAWLDRSNPFWLSFAPYLQPDSVGLPDYLAFLGSSVALAATLTLFAALTLRRAAVRSVSRGSAGVRRSIPWPRIGPPLDFNPVLWREWHRRGSRWLRVIAAIYVVLAVAAASLAEISSGGRARESMMAFVNAFTFAFGLLLVSVTSVTSLFEERVRGSLDVLMTTPLPTSRITLGKWWGSFRVVVRVTLLPALLACYLASGGGPGTWGLVGLLVLLMLAFGALVNSLGLALATWVPRFGLAVGLNVVVCVLLAAGPTLLLLALAGGNNDALVGLASFSPWFAVGETTFFIGRHVGPNREILYLEWKIASLLCCTAASIVLAVATYLTFDRCLGRVTQR
jgi:ABC-type transport system involved in multi-copper enzyme maturation permease subunit